MLRDVGSYKLGCQARSRNVSGGVVWTALGGAMAMLLVVGRAGWMNTCGRSASFISRVGIVAEG